MTGHTPDCNAWSAAGCTCGYRTQYLKETRRCAVQGCWETATDGAWCRNHWKILHFMQNYLLDDPDDDEPC